MRYIGNNNNNIGDALANNSSSSNSSGSAFHSVLFMIIIMVADDQFPSVSSSVASWLTVCPWMGVGYEEYKLGWKTVGL